MAQEHTWLFVVCGVVLLAVLGIGAKELITWLIGRAREADRRNQPPED